MLKNRVFYVLLLTMAVMLYIFTNTYYTLTPVILCIVLPIITFALMMRSRKKLRISLDVPAIAEKSDLELSYVLENTGNVPVARVVFKITLENQMTGTFKNKKVIATVPGKESVELKVAVRDCKAGTVIVNTRKIKVMDAFGLFGFKVADLSEESIIVYPEIKAMDIQMSRPVETNVDGEKYSPDKPGQDVSEIYALRDYAEGDEVRKIHWKLSTKLDKTMVRDFSFPLNYSMFMLLELTNADEYLMDAQLETYFSLSNALLENGINHNIGWYDAGMEKFNVEGLDSLEDMELAMAKVLSSFPSDGFSNSLEYYRTGGYSNSNNILVYVATDPETDKVAEVEATQRIHTVMVHDGKNPERIKEISEFIDVTAYSLEDVSKEITDFVV